MDFYDIVMFNIQVASYITIISGILLVH